MSSEKERARERREVCCSDNWWMWWWIWRGEHPWVEVSQEWIPRLLQSAYTAATPETKNGNGMGLRRRRGEWMG